jgi:hypothetical protein
VVLGLVCFRLRVIITIKSYQVAQFFPLSLKGDNDLSEKLLKSINDEGFIFMVPAKINDIFFLRFAICASSTQYKHIEFAWTIITKHANKF